ncbi:putative FAD-linked oxidoreductase [Nocardioides dokdonensis FR1436]|uniref:Putative FAD-linked oxidoreductase n=1 Tax=Nocardioides dokdonensis FR1436 TaxID=1300347 RepID=A0A1A9GRK0_9ACTN|nr:FAD-linked oxidase C-terminal domain-containing protein [Nocardioides dokdonensis]ANH40260.1 putative FAD-linked oxidoreductase [Nocardioides dokdonensis FR1436]
MSTPFDRLGPDLVTTDPDLVASYARDESALGVGSGLVGGAGPVAVVSPRSTADVAATLAIAHEHRVPVVVRGAGSGLSGAATAPDGSVVLSTRRLARVLEIDRGERLAVVQPGVVTGDLRTAVAEVGLFYPPDPGSVAFSTIGGNVATNAGGMCCVKYGVTGDFVLGLEVVLADGTITRTGRRTAKGVAGYDLTALLVGSEGTLGVITEITLRLLPAPGPARTLVATFPGLAAAGAAVAAVATAGLPLSMLEVMDRTTLDAVDRLTRMGLGEGGTPAAMLLAQCDDPAAALVLERMAVLCEAAGAVDVVSADDAAEGEALLEARRQALPALEQLGDWILDDVCVPRGRVVELLEGVERIAAAESLTIGVFGHAGDGNMHPTIVHDAADPASVAAAARAFDAITALALDLGGTITGEHGVGRLKRDWLARELDPGAMALSRALKDAVDPRGILNPGCVLPA